MIALENIKTRLFNEFGIDSSPITEGDGTEFGEPNRLSIAVNNKAVEEVNTKIGNSWYFPDSCGVRLITYGIRDLPTKWFRYQFRFIDQTNDLNTSWEWFKQVFRTTPDQEVTNRLHRLGGKFTVLGRKILKDLVDIDRQYLFTVKTPKTFYYIVDPETDVIKSYSIVDITLPYPSDEISMSLIIQVENSTGELSYSFRALTKSATPDLIKLEIARPISEENVEEILTNWKDLLISNN